MTNTIYYTNLAKHQDCITLHCHSTTATTYKHNILKIKTQEALYHHVLETEKATL